MLTSNMKGLAIAIILVVLGYVDSSASRRTFECEDLQVYPHPYNYKLYYLCFFGELRERSCEDDFEFSADQLKCLPLDEAKTTTTSTTEALTTEAKCVDYEKYPHETRCEKFYMCLGGDFYEGTCPSPLHFNTAIQECDLPEHANCQIFTTTASLPCENFQCYPHPFDCQKYYQCLNDELYLLQCPKNLAFNPKRQSCDYPSMVDCPVLPAKCEAYKKYPHEVDCNKYYYCLDEVLFLMSCHEDLHFNAMIQDCDLPAHAMCEIETRK